MGRRHPCHVVFAILALTLAASARAGAPAQPVVHPELWNATTNDPTVDQRPGLATSFSVSSVHSGPDTVEDAFGNNDGGVEPTTLIFDDSGTADNGNQTLGDGGETVDFIEWQTTSPVEVHGYRLLLTEDDPFGRRTELVRFLVDGGEEDFFDNDSASGDSVTVNEILRPFSGGPVTGSTFRIELTRATNGPRIHEIDALTESFCGNGTAEGDEECDDANTTAGDGCDLCVLESPCPATPSDICIVAEKAKLQIVETKPGNEKLKALFKGFGAATTAADFGDPASGTTRYDLCFYDDAGDPGKFLQVDRAMDTCGSKGKPCWRAKGSGFAYKDPDAASSGVKKIALASGASGKGKLQVLAGNKAKKGQTALPTPIAAGLMGSATPRLQVHISDAACFEATFTTVKKSEADLLQASRP